jgi:hydrogenase expression/formation protein HypC
MCLAVPSQITSIDENGLAQVSVMGVQRQCSVRLTPDAQVGDFVLVHAGFAIQRIEEQDARETLALLEQMPDLLGDELGDDQTAGAAASA